MGQNTNWPKNRMKRNLLPRGHLPCPQPQHHLPTRRPPQTCLSVPPSKLIPSRTAAAASKPSLCTSFSPSLPGVSQETGGFYCHFLSWMCVLDCNTQDYCSFHSHTGVTRQNRSLAKATAQNSSKRIFSGMVPNSLRKRHPCGHLVLPLQIHS